MKIFHIREEGETIKPGFNFYPLSSIHLGCALLLRNTVYRFRISKITRKIFMSKIRIDHE